MPGKSKRKGKHPQSKKSKAILRQGTAPPRPAAADTAPAPATPVPTAARPAVTRQAVTRPAARAKSTTAYVAASVERYPFFVRELKRIGLLAVIIMVVLFVLSVVLS